MAEGSASPIHTENARRGAKLDAMDLCYAVVNGKGKMQRILKNVSFDLRCGDLCALMGPSGAGKSTLLDLLAARKQVGTWSGEVYIDDAPRSKYFNKDTAYVLQDDVHIATLTVEETIRYSAMTRLDEGTSRAEIQRRVDQLLEMMGLAHVKDSYVGSATVKGISGGQLKRLSIAVEIVALPRLLFLDEPTSGLDSSIAFEVMSTVREITSSQCTCVCTIHQPSREIFALFDKLVLLSAGRLIFFGTTADAVTHFGQPELGFHFEGGFKNPAEFVIEISCGQRLAQGLRVPRQPEELEVLYKSSRFYRPSELAHRYEAKVVPADEDEDSLWGWDHSQRYATSTKTQILMLMHRSWVAKIRDTADLRAQLLKTFSIAILFGIVFYGAGDISGPFYEDGRLTSQANSMNSFLFFFTIVSMIVNMQAVPYMYSRVLLYRRELASNAYAPFPYWVSSILVPLPLLLVLHLVTVCITYGCVQMNSNGGTFFYFFLFTLLGTFLSLTVGMALAATASKEAIAMVIFSSQFLVLTTFSGFTIPMDDLPVYWKWFTYICYPRWIFEGLMVNEWSQFDTDDAPGTQNGNGDVLGDFSFDGFDKNNTVWIALLFVVGFTGIMYRGLLPARSELIRVGNASDVVTVLSANGSDISSTSSASKSRGRRFPATNPFKTDSSQSSDLKANLMENGGNLEERLVVEDPVLEHEPPLTVESFRVSTGVIDRARGCTLVFRNVHYTVTSKTDGVTQVTLLKDVTGRAMPGEMVALMGASGAGKSTLLDILAQRKTTGTIAGDITYNGSTEMKSFAYVMQDNVHMGVLTVRESIFYAAELRLSQRMSRESKVRRVNKVLDVLGLQGVADTILGTEAERGVSGGQLKRVSIGVEIVHLPNLMFLDEPTTGLDSSIAMEVMSAVRNLANQNRTVICTIHQPSEGAFALFDTLLLLAEGRVIYFGPAANAVTYFTQSPYGYVCKVGANPADFVVAVAGSFLPATDGRVVTGGELAAYYITTDNARAAAATLPAGAVLCNNNVPANPLLTPAEETTAEPPVTREYRTDLYHQVQVLLRRRLLVMQKDPMPNIAPLLREFVVGFFYGSVYYQLDSGEDCEQSCYTDRTSLLYFSVMLMIMGQLPRVGVFLEDRQIYYRERGAKAYSPFAYYLSVFLPSMPMQILNVLLYCVGLYPLTGLRAGSSHFGTFFFIMLLSAYCAIFLIYMVAAISRSTEVALSYLPAIVSFNMFYAGYVVFIPAMDDWQGKWLPYLSFFRYSFQGLVLNELQHNDDLPESHSYIDQLGFDVISIGGCCGILLLFIGIFATAFYLAVKFVDFEER